MHIIQHALVHHEIWGARALRGADLSFSVTMSIIMVIVIIKIIIISSSRSSIGSSSSSSSSSGVIIATEVLPSRGKYNAVQDEISGIPEDIRRRPSLCRGARRGNANDTNTITTTTTTNTNTNTNNDN